MSPRADPFVYLAIAIPGFLFGVGLLVAGGTILQSHWVPDGSASADRFVIDDTIAWAGWRRSAAPDGPTWFLQVRLKGDPRNFLVSAEDLTASFRERLRAARQSPRRSRRALSGWEGRPVRVWVDASVRDASPSSTPYMLSLRVDGEPVVRSPDDASEGTGKGPLFWGLIGTGMLVGLGVAGASLHHLVVCVRYWRRQA